jgi:hypothetical protein
MLSPRLLSFASSEFLVFHCSNFYLLLSLLRTAMALQIFSPLPFLSPTLPPLAPFQPLHSIWEFAPKRYPEISSHILKYPKISLNSNKSKDKFEEYERISLTG